MYNHIVLMKTNVMISGVRMRDNLAMIILLQALVSIKNVITALAMTQISAVHLLTKHVGINSV